VRKRFIFILMLAMLALALVAPSLAQFSATGTVVNASQLNVRSGPGVGFSVIGRAHFGEVVTLVGRNADASWLEIVRSSGQRGWVNSRFIAASININTLPVTFSTGVSNGVVTAFFLNVRNGPSVGFGVIGVLSRNQAVNLIGRNLDASWVQIQVPGGVTGWVNRSFLVVNINVNTLPVTSGGVTPPAPPPPTTASGMVTTFFLNFRAGPSVSFRAVAVLPQGTRIHLDGRDAAGVWVRGTVSGVGQGWVNSRFLHVDVPVSSLPIVTGSHPPPPSSDPFGTVNTGALNVRQGPSVSFAVVTVVFRSTSVLLSGRNAAGTWLQVRLPGEGGVVGWVNASFINTSYPISSLPITG
jgi:uncharacterized protein YraI